MTSGPPSYDTGAAAYDQLTGRWSRLYVPSLLATAGVAPGHAVLDLAAGTGGASVELGRHVGAAGRVLAVDLSRSMLGVAAGKVVGLPVWLAVMDGQALACRAASFDAVVCQLGLMFFPDPMRGLRECWRVLRPEGRIALQVWSRPERVPFYGLVADALSRELPEQRDTLYQPSILADARRLETLLADAGFVAVSIIPERRRLAFESFEKYWEGLEAGGSRIGQFYVSLPPDGRARVRAEVLARVAPYRSGHRLVLEAEALIGGGVKPANGSTAGTPRNTRAQGGAGPARRRL